MSDPHEWHVASDKEGFFIEDEYGEEIGTYSNTGYFHYPRWKDPLACQIACDQAIKEAIDNYEPSDADLIGDAWSGGFAENH